MDSNKEISNDTSLEVIISIVFGLVIGVLLYSIYRPPIIFHGPNSRDIVDKIFTYAGKKYRLEPQICSHPNNPQ
jgi:hypothetical protein